MVRPRGDRESRSRGGAERTRSDRPASDGVNLLNFPGITWFSAAWASDPAQTPPADGGAISTWRNGGSLGTAHTQGTGAAQPLYRASAATLNNLPAFDFDGTDDYLHIATANLAQPFIIIAVVVPHAFTGAPAVVGLSTANANRRLGFTAAGLPTIQMNSVLSGNIGLTVDQPIILQAVGDGVSSLITGQDPVVGSSSGVGTIGASAITQVALGAGYVASPSIFFNGLVAFYGMCALADYDDPETTLMTALTTMYFPA